MNSEEGSSSSPATAWVRHSFGSSHTNDIFAQISKGLDKYNERQNQKKAGGNSGRNRLSDQLAPLRKTAEAATAAKRSLAATKVRPGSSSATSSSSRHYPAVLFGSQLRPPSTAPGNNCFAPSSSYSSSSAFSNHQRSMVAEPAPPRPLKFDPPSFTFGAPPPPPPPPAAPRSLKKIATPDELGKSGDVKDDESTSVGTPPPSSAPAASQGPVESDYSRGSRSLPLRHEQADNDATAQKRKCGSSEHNISSREDQGHDAPLGCMYACPAPYFAGSNDWCKKDVDDLVAFAKTWIPELKRRRLNGEK